ncbi:MAG: hypothetical protein LBR91_00125 [Puniceicoccales bacterium]|nr:hypothetical protein [Puniceicoccales bacterium]
MEFYKFRQSSNHGNAVPSNPEDIPIAELEAGEVYRCDRTTETLIPFLTKKIPPADNGATEVGRFYTADMILQLRGITVCDGTPPRMGSVHARSSSCPRRGSDIDLLKSCEKKVDVSTSKIQAENCGIFPASSFTAVAFPEFAKTDAKIFELTNEAQ